MQGLGGLMIVEVQNRHFGHSVGFHLVVGSRSLGGMYQVRIVIQGPSRVVDEFSGWGASRNEAKSMSKVAKI